MKLVFHNNQKYTVKYREIVKWASVSYETQVENEAASRTIENNTEILKHKVFKSNPAHFYTHSRRATETQIIPKRTKASQWIATAKI